VHGDEHSSLFIAAACYFKLWSFLDRHVGQLRLLFVDYQGNTIPW
jgi:hypothetical protein